jgi:hypothetical protein
MVDANEPGPFTGVGQVGGRRQIPETLQRIDFFLKAMPQAGPERLNRFCMTVLLLTQF